MESTVSIYKKGTKSLRTTVPESIVEFLELKDGDKIDWSFVDGKTRKVIVMKKVGSR